MESFMEKFYSIDNIIIYIVVAIIILLFIFLIILIFGKKDQKLEETKRLMAMNNNDDKDAFKEETKEAKIEVEGTIQDKYPDILLPKKEEVVELVKEEQVVPEFEMPAPDEPAIEIPIINNENEVEDEVSFMDLSFDDKKMEPIIKEEEEPALIINTKAEREPIENEIKLPEPEDVVVKEYEALKEKPTKPYLNIIDADEQPLHERPVGGYEGSLPKAQIFSSVYVNNEEKEEAKPVKEESILPEVEMPPKEEPEIELPMLKGEKEPKIDTSIPIFSFDSIEGETYNIK